MKPLLTRAQARAHDAAWIARGVPSVLLMENAARGVVDAMLQRWGALRGRRLLVVAGSGNNGGDGLAVARRALVLGAEVSVLQLGAPSTDDAALQRRAWDALGGHTFTTLDEAARDAFDQAELLIDALFGTGLSRPLNGATRDLVLALCAAHARGGRVVALDIPSGLDADTGASLGDAAVKADLTVAFAAAKLGAYTPNGAEHCGEVAVVDIGVPAPPPEMCAARLLEWRDAESVYIARSLSGHKNRAGSVLVVAGSKGHEGALALCSRAVFRGGGGVVTAATWAGLERAGLQSEAMRVELDPRSLDADLQAALQGKRVVVLGPGLGTGEAAARALAIATAQHQGPLVLDADVFSMARERPELLRRAGPTVLTPHPAELGRLLGISTGEVEADRPAAARRAAESCGAVVVLKGAHTVVASADGSVWVAPQAMPVLGTAGSGDVLAGLVAACLCHHPAETAAWLGVWLHAEAGRLAARGQGGVDRGVLASEIADHVPAVWADLAQRVSSNAR